MLYSWVENSDWSFIAKQAHIQMHNKQWFIADTLDKYIFIIKCVTCIPLVKLKSTHVLNINE